jgi:hypothetical protein
MTENSISDDDSCEDEDDDYSETEDRSKHAEINGEVRGSRTNCKGHWSKEEVRYTFFS